MDFKSGNFPVGVVIFGLIALFLALRLRSVLGKRTGLDRPLPRNELPPTLPSAGQPRGPRPTDEGAARRGRFGPFRNPLARPGAEPAAAEMPPRTLPAAVQAPTSYVLPESGSSTGQALTTLSAIVPQFDAAAFLRGAEQAFRRIVEAYAAGNRAVLRELLTPAAYEAFEQAIAEREAKRETQRSEIRHVTEVALVGAEVGQGATEAGVAARPTLDVRFTSDQVSLVSNAAGEPVSGADALTELCDVWTFEGSEPAGTWRLAATRTA